MEQKQSGAEGFVRRPVKKTLEGMKVAIIDLDDTLSDTSGRRHLVDRPRGQKDWAGFFAACGQDAQRDAFVEMAQRLQGMGVGLAFFTGRLQSCKADSLAWLAERGLTPVDFRMRPEKSFLKSHQLKGYWLQDLRDKGAEVVFAMDDEDANIAMFRAAGLPVVDAKDEAVAKADFEAFFLSLSPSAQKPSAPSPASSPSP